MRELTPEDARAAVRGGGVLACGGGGWKHHGQLMGQLATSLNRPLLASTTDLPDDAWVATVTAIGAPAAADWEIRPVDYVHALQELIRRVGVPVAAVMTAQNGYSTTLNGWIQSSMLGIPVLDAAGDIRAHPTGKLGSLGLEQREGYVATQVVSGGNRRLHGPFLSINVGRVNTCDDVLRDISIRTGGFIAAARNVVELDWVAANAALGAISLALDLGHDMEAAGGDDGLLTAITRRLGGHVVDRGPLRVDTACQTYGGWDHGTLRVGDHIVTYLNEFMTVGVGDTRVATYPDTIAMIDVGLGEAIAVKDVIDGGQDVALIVVPARRLPVSSSAIDPTGLAECEGLIGEPLLKYLDPDLKGGTNGYTGD